MDYEFPRQLFPSFYNCGPPDPTAGQSSGGNWGSYGRVRPQSSSGPPSSWTFTPSHQVKGEAWRHTEPVPLPLLSPKHSCPWPSEPPDPMDFTEHIQNFLMDHGQDAFGCMSEILGENFSFKKGLRKKQRGGAVSMVNQKNYLKMLKLKVCYRTYFTSTMDRYNLLLSDVVQSVPLQLLGSLLYEELTEQRDRHLFSEATTGGALDFVPFSESGSGCLLYPSSQGLDRLNFHRVELQHHRGSSPVLTGSSSPWSFQLKGPIRQISSASLLHYCCVAVRSDHLCGVWRFGETDEPRALQVINTKEVATCVSVSPHVLGEVLVASESGIVNLWTVGKGIQKVRKEDSNLYFNAKSSWRWCEFSAHPRVMLYADRTGVELTDTRTSPVSGHTLFRISNISECRSGERLIVTRYLGDAHPFHHLINTQYSAYIMDERFPGVPMLKCDHMMESPPLFSCVLPASTSSGAAPGGARTTKVLLGSQSSQEIYLLQYSGGRSEACCSRGPVQALLRPRDSLKHLPVQIPHRLDTASNRLSLSAAGLTCFQTRGASAAGVEERVCVLQLTEAGDVFYQILEPEQSGGDAPRPSAAEDEPPPPPQHAARSLLTPTEATEVEQLVPDSQLDAEDTWSDDGIVGPTQHLAVPRFVAETPEREQPAETTYSDDSDSDSGGKRRRLRQSGLQVIVNDEPELDHMSELDHTSEVDAGEQGGEVERGEDAAAEEPSSAKETPVQLSDGALITWKHWLQKLMKKSSNKKPRPCLLKHLTISTEGFLHPPEGDATDPTEEEHVQNLRRDLRACMSQRSLLVDSAVPASLRAPDMEALPNPVDTDAWGDRLSQRLTQSWQGEASWRAWWYEELGLNREEKVQALKRKRRREKQAKRASGHGLGLAGSFTSSVSRLSDLNSFSDSTGWSDNEGSGPLSQLKRRFLEVETARATTPPALEEDTQASTLTATPRSVSNRQDDQPAPPSSSRTPASQRMRKYPEDPPCSVSASQDEPLRAENNPLPSSSSSQSAPLRTLRVDLSQDSLGWAGFSQSQSFSQSSQGRLGSSQPSQTKKKRSRMGF